MVKPHPSPSYQPLTHHLACLSVIYRLLYPFSSHCNSSYTYGMKLKLTLALALDKISKLMTLSTLSSDSCKFEKWRHQSTSFNKRTYLWKFYVNTTSISQDIAWSLFFQQILVCKLWPSLNLNTLLTHT